MQAIIQITHKQMNDLDTLIEAMPVHLHDVEAITMLDTDGKVQAGAVFNINDNNGFEGLHHAVKTMGINNVRFIMSSAVVMDSSTHDCEYIPAGFWTEVTTQIKPVGPIYVIGRKQYFVNTGE